VQQPIPLTQIELEIRDLLREAESFSAARESDSDTLTELIVELFDCASRAKRARFPFSEQKLLAAANRLGRLRNNDQASPLGRIA